MLNFFYNNFLLSLSYMLVLYSSFCLVIGLISFWIAFFMLWKNIVNLGVHILLSLLLLCFPSFINVIILFSSWLNNFKSILRFISLAVRFKIIWISTFVALSGPLLSLDKPLEGTSLSNKVETADIFSPPLNHSTVEVLNDVEPILSSTVSSFSPWYSFIPAILSTLVAGGFVLMNVIFIHKFFSSSSKVESSNIDEAVEEDLSSTPSLNNTSANFNEPLSPVVLNLPFTKEIALLKKEAMEVGGIENLIAARSEPIVYTPLEVDLLSSQQMLEQALKESFEMAQGGEKNLLSSQESADIESEEEVLNVRPNSVALTEAELSVILSTPAEIYRNSFLSGTVKDVIFCRLMSKAAYLEDMLEAQNKWTPLQINHLIGQELDRVFDQQALFHFHDSMTYNYLLIKEPEVASRYAADPLSFPTDSYHQTLSFRLFAWSKVWLDTHPLSLAVKAKIIEDIANNEVMGYNDAPTTFANFLEELF